MIIAPAKNILFGEHAVVYPPNTAIIAANNLTCKADVKKNNTSSTINVTASGTYPLTKTYDIVLLLDYLNIVREEYKKFKETNDITILKSVMKEDDDLLKLSIAVALDYIKKHEGTVEGFTLYLLSEVPLQSGFGSSAVFSSSVIAAILDCFVPIKSGEFANKINRDRIFDITMQIEEFQHGNPSGEGPAAVIYGGLIKLNKNLQGKPTIQKLQITNTKLQKLMKGLRIVHSGMPEQSTGELVSFVRDNLEINRQIIEKIEINTQRFLEINESETCEESEFIKLINVNGEYLEKLGVVSNSAQEFCDEIRELGGAAKISGAGGQGDGGSGALLVYLKDRVKLKELTEQFQYNYFDIEFGVEGILKH